MTLDVILATTARHYGVPLRALRGKSRQRRVVEPRHVATYLARELLDLSFPELGRRLWRDHSTIQHACRKVERDLAASPLLRARVEHLRAVCLGQVDVLGSRLQRVEAERDAALAEVERLRAILAGVHAATAPPRPSDTAAGR